MKPTHSLRILSGSIAAFLSIQSAHAATIYWDGTGTGWDVAANWSTAVGFTTPDPAAIPGASDVAFFSISTITNTAQTVNLNANQAALGLIFLGTNSATTTLLGGETDRALTLGTSGIAVNSGAGAVSIGSSTAGQGAAITLGGSQTWTNNSTNTLTIENAVTNGANNLIVNGSGNTTVNGAIGNGAGALTMSGAGTLTLSGANTYTGTTTVSKGTLNVTGSLNGTSGTALNIGAGTFSVGEASGVSQSMGAISFGGGMGTIQSTNNGGNSFLTFSHECPAVTTTVVIGCNLAVSKG